MIENRPGYDRAPWFADAMRSVVRSFSEGNLALVLKRDDRVFSFSVSEHGERHR